MQSSWKPCLCWVKTWLFPLLCAVAELVPYTTHNREILASHISWTWANHTSKQYVSLWPLKGHPWEVSCCFSIFRCLSDLEFIINNRIARNMKSKKSECFFRTFQDVDEFYSLNARGSNYWKKNQWLYAAPWPKWTECRWLVFPYHSSPAIRI